MGVSLSIPSASRSSSLNRFQYSASTNSTTAISSTTGDCEFSEIPRLPYVFTFEELKSATNNFNSLASGFRGLGRVCKGWLHENTLSPAKPGSGMLVAVKKMKLESTQGFQEWKSEIMFLTSLSHPNLIKLLGYCCDNLLFLVYEFMPRGSLWNHLFRSNPNSLSWNTRLKIAIGAAGGLCFLHASENPVIHRGLNLSNILLDMNYNAKISDFGLVRLGPSGEKSHVTSTGMGTMGYAAPEYIATGHLTVKSDVYGFGVVLLEILTGKRAFDTNRPTGQQNLVEWTKPCLSSRRKLKTIMDAKIEGQYSPKVALQAAQLTLKCLENDPKQRPSMKEVLQGLEAVEAIHHNLMESKNPNSQHTSHQTRRQSCNK